ncbi:protodermal factor 1-like [Zingiber officinale]|uniref:protodermal factor 1-like n=1 Tax=Zingiber officinale TaxID=94328 RepID=UPI001C4BD42E|nr:protodermal factor 1-like [Zingiber officinale]
MEWKGFLVCFLVLELASQNVAMSRSLPEQEFAEQKNYYPPSTGGSPSHSGSSHGTATPSHGAPSTPSGGGGGYYHSPPSSTGGGSSPAVNPSPSTPAFDPHNSPFFTGTCKYWGSHPEVITAVVGSWGSIGDLFGHSCAAIFGSNPSLPAALTNTRQDGYGALFREGTASFLNSMTNSKFPYSTPQVKSAFAGAIASDGMAQAQADIFKQANEGKIKVLS